MLRKDEDLIHELINTRKKKMVLGYVAYSGRSLYKHKMLDHRTDMLCAITAAALEAYVGTGESRVDVETMWGEAYSSARTRSRGASFGGE